MIYRYLINDTLLLDDDVVTVNEPSGWEGFTTSIKRDYNIKGILQTQDASITFQGAGYTLLKELFESSGFTAVANITIEKSPDYGESWKLFFKGTLFLTQIEWDEKRNYAKCKLQDDSYYARINNNKSIECNVYAGQSKNGDAIPIPTLYQIAFFNPDDNSYYSLPDASTYGCKGYRVHDVMKYVIAFISDDLIDFRSDVLDTGRWNNLMMTTGMAIRHNTVRAETLNRANFEESWPKINFSQMMKEIANGIDDLWFTIERTAQNKPVFRLEPRDYFFPEDTTIHATDEVNELKTKTDLQRLYSRLTLGTDKTFENSAAFPEDISFKGFKSESFNMLGNANIDKTLDLTRTFIASSNLIYNIFKNNKNDEDESIFLIDCAFSSGIAYAKHSNWLFTGPPEYYNEALTNENCAGRFLKAVPNSIANWLGTGDDKFLAWKTTPKTLTHMSSNEEGYLIGYNEDTIAPGYDSNSNYDTATDKYTVPSGGLYTFRAKLKVKVTDISYAIYMFDYNWLTGPPLIGERVEQTVSRRFPFFGDVFDYDMSAKKIWIGGNTINIPNSKDRMYGQTSGFVASINKMTDVQITDPVFYGHIRLKITKGTSEGFSTQGIEKNPRTYYFDTIKQFNANTSDNVESKIYLETTQKTNSNYRIKVQFSIAYGTDNYFTCFESINGGGLNYKTYDPEDYSALQHEYEYELTEEDFEKIAADPRGYIHFGRFQERMRNGWIENIQFNHQQAKAKFLLDSSKNTNPR